MCNDLEKQSDGISQYLHHASNRVFVSNIDKSLDFYTRIGFTQRYVVIGLARYLSLGVINIELWENPAEITRPGLIDKNNHEYTDPLLFINTKSIDALTKLFEIIAASGIKPTTQTIVDNGGPYGRYFAVVDPDGNEIIFRHLLNTSNNPT